MNLKEAEKLVFKYYPGESRESILAFLGLLYVNGYYIMHLNETKGKEAS